MPNNDNKILNLLRRAEILAELSPDADTKVGSILVAKNTKSVIAEGFNGFLRGARDQELPNYRPDKNNYIVHSEINLLLNCARNGISTNNCITFQTHSPCINCARALLQAGIDKVFFKNYYPGTDKINEFGDMYMIITDHGDYKEMQLGVR